MQENRANSQSLRILRVEGVLELVPISRAAHFDKLNKKSKNYDPTYPKPVMLGSRSSGYIEGEVIAWIEARMEERA